MSMMTPPPAESLPMAGGPMPPDQQPQALRQFLQGALAIIANDRFSPEDQQDLAWFIQEVTILAQTKGQQQPGNDMNNPAAQQQETQAGGAAEQSGGGIEPYMSHVGSPKNGLPPGA